MKIEFLYMIMFRVVAFITLFLFVSCKSNEYHEEKYATIKVVALSDDTSLLTISLLRRDESVVRPNIKLADRLRYKLIQEIRTPFEVDGKREECYTGFYILYSKLDELDLSRSDFEINNYSILGM